jgi:hypothetical protein
MDVAFNSQRLRSLCENEAIMVDQLGKVAAGALQICLADLDAASTIADVTVNYAAEVVLTADIQLTPCEGLCVRVRPNNSQARRGRKPIDWRSVSRVKIMEISLRA